MTPEPARRGLGVTGRLQPEVVSEAPDSTDSVSSLSWVSAVADSLARGRERGGDIRYLPSLLIQFHFTLCTAGCKM